MMAPSYSVIIVGGGLAGLATAISMIEKGHRVSILEAASKMSEIGAGIQVPPNSVRVLKRLGVYEKIANEATWPSSIVFRRWQDGSQIGSTPLLPFMDETYGNPYFLIHRGEYHRILLEKVIELNGDFRTNAFVTNICEAEGTVTLADGTQLKADLIIGADGIKSRTRKFVVKDRDIKIYPDSNCSFRTLIPGEAMAKSPQLRPLLESPTATCWIGPEGHIMAYPIRGGKLYNFVMYHPGSVEVGKPNEPASLDFLRAEYETWDPTITELINLVPECFKWQNAEIEKLETWVSKSGKLVLLGDAAHGMVPYIAQGAGMAMEDAIAVTECISRAKSVQDIPKLMKFFEVLRRDRCYTILDSSRKNADIWHLPDGPAQRERDKGIKKGSKVNFESTQIEEQNPNRWSDAKFQPWMFGFDVFEDVKIHL